MNILEATEVDLEECLQAAREFHSIYDPKVKFSPDAFLRYWKFALAAGNGVMLLAREKSKVVGGIGGVLVSFQTSDVLNFVEMFYWVKKEHRGTLGLRLIRKMEHRAKEMGADRILMACMENSEPDRVEKLYRTLGYTPIERHFMKEV